MTNSKSLKNKTKPPSLRMRIFRPPVRATVTLQEGRPARIACPRRKEICGEILWAAGPWRTSGDWWEQEGWARDEWDIALQEATGIRSIAWSGICSADSGRWREAMIEEPGRQTRTSDFGRQTLKFAPRSNSGSEV